MSALPPGRLERVCRYALRPPRAQERLHRTSEGEIWLTLRRRWADGTTHLRFDPLELLERLAVLTPRPQVNLILYYGVLAARAAWRAAIVPAIADGVDACEEAAPEDGNASCAQRSRAGAYQWAELMRWTFGLDVLACTRCGGRLRLVALIDQTSVIQRILRHLGLPSNVPEPRPARPPPRPLAPIEDQSQDAPEFDAAWRVWRPAGKDVGSKRCRFPCDAFSLAMFCQAAAKSRPTAVSSRCRRGRGWAESEKARSVNRETALMLPIVHAGHSRGWQGVFRRLPLCRPIPLVPSSLRRACVLVALALLTATHAAAHAGSVAFWRITMTGTTARSEVLLSPDDVHRMAPGAATLETTGPVDVSRLAGFDAALLAHFAIEQDGAAVAARIVAARVLPSGLLQVDMEHASIDPSRALALRATFHAVTDDTHRVIGRVDRRGVVTSLVFDATTPRHVVGTLPRASWRDGLAPAGSTRSMVLLGIEHILTGYDHLVFLGCLLLAGGTWRSRLGIVSAFTVAHSVTLVLAAMRLVNPPAGFVEPAIAVTIAYVALENLIGDAARSRWPTAFGFGLIHGFGFAGMLDVLDLPARQWFAAVLAFNAGVEIGQVAVVAIAMPIVIALARSSWHPRVVRYASSAVLGLSVLWFVERLP